MKSSSSETSTHDCEIRLNERKTYSEIYLEIGLEVLPVEEVGKLIANLLNKMVSINEGPTPPKTIFHSKVIPGISIEKYLIRLAQYARCSSESFVMALIYIDRYFEKNISQSLIPKNVHKLFFISLVTAAKFNDDLKLANWAFAKLGGMDKADLCMLEIQYLRAIEFNVYVSSIEYVNYLKSVVEFRTE